MESSEADIWGENYIRRLTTARFVRCFSFPSPRAYMGGELGIFLSPRVLIKRTMYDECTSLRSVPRFSGPELMQGVILGIFPSLIALHIFIIFLTYFLIFPSYFFHFLSYFFHISSPIAYTGSKARSFSKSLSLYKRKRTRNFSKSHGHP